ncbi:insecticidal delta-endotoxin Cry8Ea1 family protein, partial [Bacillus thuringiensis]|uniref:insecticidal delta-endotoxin Cry8Ea1 family protein n=1 Tax=Bacillus thuringiensis TaxID=1428 RepID=UPI0018CCE279
MNRNEYNKKEVKPSSSNLSPKYPLMNCLDTKSQNVNYKDSLNVIKGDYQELDPSTSTRAASDAITAALSITSTMLGALGHPITGALLGVFNTLTGLLWPGGGDLTWEELLAEGEEIINKTITESIKNDALLRLEEARKQVDEYSGALNDWILNPGVRISAATMRSIFITTVQQLAVQMVYFERDNYQIPLLPVYAQAANLHLVVLKDITIFGEEWGFPETDINFYYKSEFLEHIEEYTDYVVKWYKEGLNELQKSSSTDWVAYNRYRREMTILALDIIALFPAYDGFLYPLETNTELTREVYMDPEGGGPTNWRQYPISFTQIENLIRPPHLFTWLNSIQIETDKELTADDYYVCMWAGSLLGLHYTNSSSVFTVKNGSGDYKKLYDLSGKDVYQTLLYAGSSHEAGFSKVTDFVGNEGGTFNLVSESGTTSSFSSALCGISNTHLIDSVTVLPPDISDPSQSLSKDYTHRLSYVTNVSYYRNQSVDFDRVELPILGWTHRSVGFDNRIYPYKITQVPAVKANKLDNSAMTVVEGPNFTGGALVKVNSTGGGRYSLKFSVKADPNNLSQKYYIRLRYAGEWRFNQSNYRSFTISINGNKIEGKGFLSNTRLETDEVPTLFNDFGWTSIKSTFTFPKSECEISLDFYDENSTIGPVGPVFIDRIEVVPADDNYGEKENLEKAQKAVNALFTAGRHALQTGVTDYKVDQVSILVDCVSGELYPNEKRELQNLIKYAKRLSYSRNLLLDPTFDSINSSEENGWYGSNGIAIGNGNLVFKGNYIIFSGTNDTQYPTYLYQKIDESKLKEYTRYKLRGFIENSQDLEAYVVRYDAKHETLDVSNNLFPDISPVNACGEPNRCAALPYLDENPRLECSSIQDGILSDSHSFSLNIDTGSIDSNENVGIWVLFKISTPEGYAKFGNLEVIEDGPVIGEALARVKRQETKWRNKLTQLRTETQAIYTRAKQAIDNLFTNAQDSHLKIGATFASIVAARKIVQSIREAYMPWLSIVPGVNYPIFTELNERVQRAFQLYDVRNVVRNGRFLSGVSDWIVTSDVKVQEENGNNVLVLSNWDAQVLQCLKLYQD